MMSSKEALSSSSETATAKPCSATVMAYWLAVMAWVFMRTPSTSGPAGTGRLLYRMKLTVRPGMVPSSVFFTANCSKRRTGIDWKRISFDQMVWIAGPIIVVPVVTTRAVADARVVEAGGAVVARPAAAYWLIGASGGDPRRAGDTGYDGKLATQAGRLLAMRMSPCCGPASPAAVGTDGSIAVQEFLSVSLVVVHVHVPDVFGRQLIRTTAFAPWVLREALSVPLLRGRLRVCDASMLAKICLGASLDRLDRRVDLLR